MTLYGIIFYILGILLLLSTALAVSRSQLIHAVVYLAISFLATALLFYLLGAPFLSALEVVIYAGAIMVMFLFMIMTLSMEKKQRRKTSSFRPWVDAIVVGTISLVVLAALMTTGQSLGLALKPATVSPLEFGRYLFREFWFSVEVASFLLFVALAGALYLGRGKIGRKRVNPPSEEAS